MAIEYILSYTASEINRKLGKIDNLASKNEIPYNTSDLVNDSGFATENYVRSYAQPKNNYALKSEIPEVPVKSVNQQTGDVNLTAEDVGALPSDTVIPRALADLTDDNAHRLVTDNEKSIWNAKSNFSGSYNDLTNKPTIPSIDGLATEEYVASQISAIPTPNVSGQISIHNTATDAHNDIRLLVDGLTTRLNALANSTDEDLDQMAEIVAYIKSNKSLIENVTTNKVNVSDIVDNLTTNTSNKPLSAAQGVVLKSLIDAIKVPTKVSELTNDSGYLKSIPSEYVTETELNAKGYLTQHQSLADYVKTSELGALAKKNVVAKTDLSSDVQASLGKADTALQSYTETDPTVPSWAKASTKPSYTKSEVGLGNVDNVKQYSASNPPPYPVTSVNGKTGAVTLDAAAVGARPSTWTPTAANVGADPVGTANSVVSAHNSNTSSHSDIRGLISDMQTEVDAKADASMVAYINAESNENITDVEPNPDTNVANAVLYTEQDLTDAQKAQARENIGVVGLDPDCHTKYFQVTDEGVISLRPEYRGKSTRTAYEAAISDRGSGVAGSKNMELPKHLIVPEIIDGVLVDALADAIFSQNLAIKAVTLPRTISAIPDYGFDQCWYLTNIYNTENITSLGNYCLQATAIDRAYFPNLKTMGEKNVFYCCGHLVYADIGNVNTITDCAFERCSKLNSIRNSGVITTVGARAFRNTYSLKRINFVENLTNIDAYGFTKSKVNYEWDSLSNCTFGTNATSAQLNPTDIWSDCIFTACENPIPTRFSQYNPQWTDRVFTTWQGTGRTLTYSSGCQWMCAMHIYCGIRNISLSSAPEFETIVDNINPTLRNTFEGNASFLATLLTELGLYAIKYSGYNQDKLQLIYDALLSGGYVCVTVGSGANTTGHTVVIYGVNTNGEFLILDSSSDTYDDRSNYLMYSLMYKDMISPETDFVIVTP